MTRTINITLILIASIFVLTSHPAVAGFKCWTNHEGVRECGNVVPPEFAQKGHEEISSGGIVTKRVERAKTGEELVAEEEMKQAAEEKIRLAEEQQKSDRVLLDTFSNADEISITRDSKINLINNEIKITQGNIIKLQDKLKGLRQQAANNERNGRKVTKKQLNNLDMANKQVKKYQHFVDKKIKERIKVQTDYDAMLVRLEELTGKSKTPASSKIAPQ